MNTISKNHFLNAWLSLIEKVKEFQKAKIYENEPIRQGRQTLVQASTGNEELVSCIRAPQGSETWGNI